MLCEQLHRALATASPETCEALIVDVSNLGTEAVTPHAESLNTALVRNSPYTSPSPRKTAATTVGTKSKVHAVDHVSRPASAPPLHRYDDLQETRVLAGVTRDVVMPSASRGRKNISMSGVRASQQSLPRCEENPPDMQEVAWQDEPTGLPGKMQECNRALNACTAEMTLGQRISQVRACCVH
jgi:hypothetical protein